MWKVPDPELDVSRARLTVTVFIVTGAHVVTALRVFTLLVLALEAGEEHGLALVGAPELDGGVAHLIVATLRALPLNHGAVRLVVVLALLLLLGVLLAVEVDNVAHLLLVKQGARHHVLADHANHIALGSQC